MAGNGFSVAGLRILPKRVFRALPPQYADRPGEDDGAIPRPSSDYYEFLPGIGRQSTQGFISSVLENQGNGLTKVRQTFLARLALPIGTWHFSAVRDMPWAVSLDNRREFVAHFFILPPGRRSRICFDLGATWPVHPGARLTPFSLPQLVRQFQQWAVSPWKTTG